MRRGVCECVLVRGRAKRTCRGVESGVIPALFKTTCQHGIRPGLLRWRPRSSVSAAGLLPPPRSHTSLGFHCCFNSESEDFLQGRKLYANFWNCIFDAPFDAPFVAVS